MATKTKSEAGEAEMNEIEALKAELAAAKAALAEREVAAAPVEDHSEELVDFTLPVFGIDGANMEPLFVAVNGESIAIKPGVPVKIKRKFLEVLEHAQGQQVAALKYMQGEQRKALSEL